MDRCKPQERPGKPSWPAEELIVGDMAGVSLPRAGISNVQDGVVRHLDRCWLGLARDHLKRCASSGKPGVIVCAFDPRKAEAVVRACQLGLVSRLVISSALAQALA